MWKSLRLPMPDSLAENTDYRRVLAEIFGYSGRTRSSAALQADRALKRGRMRLLLERLGDPQQAYRTVLVGGTKGKGSTAASLASMLRAAGLRVGRYTSPHLVSWCERSWCDGAFITQDEVVALFPRVAVAVSGLESAHPELGLVTTFEVGTALTLLYFAECQIDLAVVEVGIGGRTDATNALDPELSVITSVSLDHLEVIGPTLADIAFEKAGIMRRDRPVIVAPQRVEVFEILRAQALERESPLTDIQGEWSWSSEAGEAQLPAGRAPFRAEGPGVLIGNCQTPLIGRVQRENALTAIAAAANLLSDGQRSLADAVRQGLRSVHWPGRAQVMRSSPLALVDGAHNAESAEQLVTTLEDCFEYERLSWVIGMTSGKDIAGFLAAIIPSADHLYVAASHHERALGAGKLAQRCQDQLLALGRSETPVEVVATPTEGLDRALRQSGSADAICVAGSLFLVGELFEAEPPSALTH
jgi:dihydrofolate synthase/folylpolyglutamate synthase